MGSTPKRWVMKPLTPRLEKYDLRAMLSPGGETLSPESYGRDADSPTFSFDKISVARVHSSVTVSAPNGEHVRDVVVHARQVAVSEEGSVSEDWQPSDPSSPGTPSSTDSHAGFYSFVEDPTSPEAESNEAYMVSPERQAKLSTLKEKNSFKLQTYVEERRPEKLFQESNGDSCYLMEDVLAEDNKEEEDVPDRTEIIRSQAPKKKPALKEQWSALENLDLSKSPNRLIEGFSLCYSPVITKSPQTEAEPGAIDNQQIDFNAARKQFQLMERSQDNPFRYSPQQTPKISKLRARSLPAEAFLSTKDVSKNKNLEDGVSQYQFPWKLEEETKGTVTIHEDPEERIQSSSVDDLDSALARHSENHTNEDSVFFEPSEMLSPSMASMSETPIEKEIRVAREREEDLRRSRGIFRADSSEMVEIKTKPILSQPLPQIKPIKAKETNRVSFLIQREMDKVNHSPLSDRRTPGDVGEKRRTFGSQSDEVPVRSVNVENTRITEDAKAEEKRHEPDSQEILSPCCPHRHHNEAMIQKGPTVEFLDRTVRTTFYTLEGANDNDANVANQTLWTPPYKVKEFGRMFSPINSPSSPPEPVIGSKATVARRAHWESSGEWSRMLSTSDIIRKEIEEDLRREQELQEQRETSSLSLRADQDNATSEPTTSEAISNNNDRSLLNSSQENLVEVDAVLPDKSTKTSYNLSHSWSGDIAPARVSLPGPSSRLPSVSIMTAQPWGGTKPSSPAFPKATPTVLANPQPEASSTPTTPAQKGLTETLLEDFEERRVRQKLEESAYAGIQPIDDINNEVVEATRVTRHKSSRALRWEAGVYANEDNNC
ncbi:mitotic interactor and substrate of PLK1 [Hoplias malabaricus]|uniref:mitotic interactor and substrate of PLK1 n=1 Tax=Hoplias malabaricus TaxID=27720 RepID=UPI0034636016